MKLYPSLAGKLKQLRKSRHLSQETIAEAIHMTRQGYQHYESGINTPTIKRLNMLSEFYGIPLLDLISDEVELTDARLPGEDAVYGTTMLELERKMTLYFRRLTEEQKQRVLDTMEQILRT